MKLIKYTFSTPLCSHRTKGVDFSAIIYKHKSIKCCFYTPMCYYITEGVETARIFFKHKFIKLTFSTPMLYNMTKGVETARIFCKHKLIKLTFSTPMLYNMTKGVEIAGIFCKHKSQIIKSIEKTTTLLIFPLYLQSNHTLPDVVSANVHPVYVCVLQSVLQVQDSPYVYDCEFLFYVLQVA